MSNKFVWRRGDLKREPQDRLRRLIEDYSGKTVVHLDAVPDPQYPGVYAVRLYFRGEVNYPTDLIVDTNVHPDEGIMEGEFESWPPPVRRS